MKTGRWLPIVCFLMVATTAMAEKIGVYSDATGASCNLGPAGQLNPNATVMHLFSTGATGSRFKVVFPAGTAFFGFSTSYVPIGALDTDLSLAYGGCVAGAIILGTITAIYGAGEGHVTAADLQPNIIYTNCVFAELPIVGERFYVGVDGFPCNAIPVAPSTWGKVKSLYRD